MKITRKQYEELVEQLNKNRSQNDAGGITASGLLYGLNPHSNRLEPIMLEIKEDEIALVTIEDESPPNLRPVNCCNACDYSEWTGSDNDVHCNRYNLDVSIDYICDDYK